MERERRMGEYFTGSRLNLPTMEKIVQISPSPINDSTGGEDDVSRQVTRNRAKTAAEQSIQNEGKNHGCKEGYGWPPKEDK